MEIVFWQKGEFLEIKFFALILVAGRQYSTFQPKKKLPILRLMTVF
jgi:hypothetical protein